MSISIGSRPAPAVTPPLRLDVVAQGAGPVGPSERLPDRTIKVFRELFGNQIDRLPDDRFRVWNGSLQQETKDRVRNGSIFYSQKTKLWHAVVWPDFLKQEAKKFPNPKGFEDAIKAQEGFHALTFHALRREHTEVGGELVSMKVYKDYFLYPMQHTLNHVRNKPIKGYEHIYHYSLHTLGVVAQKYGLPYSGSTIDKGRQLMNDFIQSGVSRADSLTFDFLRGYARKNFRLIPEEQFLDDLRRAFLQTFSEATRQILGQPGKFTVR